MREGDVSDGEMVVWERYTMSVLGKGLSRY